MLRILLVALFFSNLALADSSFEVGQTAIRKMAGCFLIDYSYVETEALKPGYQKDNRVYDVNKNKSVKELIYVIEMAPTRFRLQHILFAAALDGKVMQEGILRHQAEDWEYAAPFRYNFIRPGQWEVQNTSSLSDQWTRRITNLDDGLRYQCSAPWQTTTSYPEWTCSNYSPIPGRETRDMGRKDYNTLMRGTRIVNYGTSWLERQNNVKTIHAADDQRTELAKEEGKNWYVRLPDSECNPVREFVRERTDFWALLQEVWTEVLDGQSAFTEKTMQPSRYMKVMELEEKYSKINLRDSSIRQQVKSELLQIIESYRVR